MDVVEAENLLKKRLKKLLMPDIRQSKSKKEFRMKMKKLKMKLFNPVLKKVSQSNQI